MRVVLQISWKKNIAFFKLNKNHENYGPTF